MTVLIRAIPTTPHPITGRNEDKEIMIGKKIINKIIKEGLVSADSERVSVWREDAVSVLNGVVDYLISQEGKKVACGAL